MTIGFRNRVLSQVVWIDETAFICLYKYQHPRYMAPPVLVAGYGWSKGAGFMLYKIDEGHIEKMGTANRAELLAEFPYTERI